MFLMRGMQSIARENLGDTLEKDNFKILLEVSSLNMLVLISASHAVQRVHWLRIKGDGKITSYQGQSRTTQVYGCLVSLAFFNLSLVTTFNFKL